MLKSLAKMFGGTNNPSQNNKKRKSTSAESTQQSPADDEQTQDFSSMKTKLLSANFQQSHNTSIPMDLDDDQENNSQLSNLRPTPTLTSTTLKSSTYNPSTMTMPTLIKKFSTNSTITPIPASLRTSLIAPAPTTTTTPTIPKEDSPPKKQKLNSGEAFPIPAPNAAAAVAAVPSKPLPPMPASIVNMITTFQLDLESQIDKLKRTADFQITSLKQSFKNEMNKIPTKVRKLTLAEFLDKSKYDGDSNVVMHEPAMATQSKLENWVAATPRLRSSRKHRDMILATPSHNNLLATSQRLTRATAKKMGAAGVTGLGLATIPESPAAASLDIHATMALPPKPLTINLADAVYETPSARNRTKSRVEKTNAAPVPPIYATAPANLSIASLMASAVKSAKKKAPAPEPVPMELDVNTSTSTVDTAAGVETATESESEAASAATARGGKKGGKSAKGKAATAPKASAAATASSTARATAAKKRGGGAKATAAKKSKAASTTPSEVDEEEAANIAAAIAISMEDIGVNLVNDAPAPVGAAPAAAEQPKRVTRARAKKGSSESS